MMENDFEPRLGHKFKFRSTPLPGLESTIHCEVIELDEPKRLIYTWRDSPTCEPSLVVWTLTPVEGGTQLQLKHQEYSYAVAIASQPRRTSAQDTMGLGLFLLSAPYSSDSRYESASRQAGQASDYDARDYDARSFVPTHSLHAVTAGLNSPQSFGWQHRLEQRLLDVLLHL
jgi:hypothetical protein